VDSGHLLVFRLSIKELDGPAISVIAEVKQRWSVIGWVTKNYYLELLLASEGTLSRWSQLHLQSLAPTKPHWAHVVGYGPFLCVIHKEGLCPTSGDINRLMMMMNRSRSSLVPRSVLSACNRLS
jgi:hypothetical protein